MKVPDLLMVFALTLNILPKALSLVQNLNIQVYHYINGMPPQIVSRDYATNIHIYNERNEKFPGTTILIEDQKYAIIVDVPWTGRGGSLINNIIDTTRTLPNLVIFSYGHAEPHKIGYQRTVGRFPGVETLELHKERYGAGARVLTPPLSSRIFGDKIYIGDLTLTMHHRDSIAAYLCIPEHRIILGGVGVYWGIHPKIDKAPTLEMRLKWQRVLEEIIDAKPNSVFPGNYVGRYPPYAKAAEFTLEYLQKFENALRRYNYAYAGGVIREMETAYPKLHDKDNLYISASILTGNILRNNDWHTPGVSGWF